MLVDARMQVNGGRLQYFDFFLYLCICIKLLCYLGKLLRFPKKLGIYTQIFCDGSNLRWEEKTYLGAFANVELLRGTQYFCECKCFVRECKLFKRECTFCGRMQSFLGGCNTFAREWYFCEQAKVSQGLQYFCERTQVICERTQMFCKFLGERHYFCEKIQVFCKRMQ